MQKSCLLNWYNMFVLCHSERFDSSWEEVASELKCINAQRDFSWLYAVGETRQAFRNHGFKSTCPLVQSAFPWIKWDAFVVSRYVRLTSHFLLFNFQSVVVCCGCYPKHCRWIVYFLSTPLCVIFVGCDLRRSQNPFLIPQHIDWLMGVVHNPLQATSVTSGEVLPGCLGCCLLRIMRPIGYRVSFCEVGWNQQPDPWNIPSGPSWNHVFSGLSLVDQSLNYKISLLIAIHRTSWNHW